MNKLKELLFLNSIKGVGVSKIHKNYVNSVSKSESYESFVEKIIDSGDYSLDELKVADSVACSKYEQISQADGYSVITMFDDNYPLQLKDLGDKSPLFLYAKGNVDVLDLPGISVIGTRKPSEWCAKVEERIVKRIIDDYDRVIISGLAEGCDMIAHKTAVEMSRPTIAVLPSGINNIFPKSNTKLAEEIIEKGGCLISEYDPEDSAQKFTYVRRDSVIAALGGSVLVIDCGVKSGTMHTVDFAVKLGRPVGCYYDEKGRGDFSGNISIIDNKGGVKILDIDDLKDFMNDNQIQNYQIESGKNSEQLSLF